MKIEQELCVQKLGGSLQKLNSLSPKNIKRKICRRKKEKKIAELKVAIEQILIKLNQAFLNEEKPKEEVANSSTENIEYTEEINNLNKLLNESLVWKTKHQKLKWCHHFAMKKQSNENDILGTSYNARISELKQQILILENEKCEVEDKLSSYMKGVIKTKENGQYTDAVRATYQDRVMMGVGINNIEHVVHTVLTNFTNMNIKCLPKATFA